MKKLHYLSVRQRRLANIFFIIIVALSILIAAGLTKSRFLGITIAQATPSMISGEWTAEYNAKWAGQLQISFTRRSDKGGYSNNGESFSLSDLSGLPPSDISASAKKEVKFSVIREAGTISCEGYFLQGRGSGFWTFTPNQGFASAMKDRGYAGLTEEDLLRSAFHNLTVKYTDDLKSAGYDRLQFDTLVRAAGHDISLAYIGELKNAGYTSVSMEEMIRAHNHEIDGAYVAQVKAMGFDKQPLDTIIRMRNHEIDADYINKMKSAGFSDLSVDDLIRLKDHEVTTEFVKEIKAEGYSEISAETAIRLKNHDIDGDFIRRAKAQGYANATLDDLIRLGSKGTIK